MPVSDVLECAVDGGVKPPEWYAEAKGSFTIRTRYSTHVIRSKPEGSSFPFTTLSGHKEKNDGEEFEPQNPDIEAGEILIKKWGEDREEKYEVKD